MSREVSEPRAFISVPAVVDGSPESHWIDVAEIAAVVLKLRRNAAGFVFVDGSEVVLASGHRIETSVKPSKVMAQLQGVVAKLNAEDGA